MLRPRKLLPGGKIDRIRIAVNGVAAHPWRLSQVEEAVTGKPVNEETAEMAGKMAIEGAVPLRYNGLQSPAYEEPREARDSRWRFEGGRVNIIQWAISPWGQRVPIHIAWDLLYVCGHRRAAVPDRPRNLRGLLGEARTRTFRGERFRSSRPKLRGFPSTSSDIRSARACFTGSWPDPCSCCCLPRFCQRSATSFAWVKIHWIAGIVLDRLRPVPHHPRHVCAGFLVHLAEQAGY